MRPETSRRTLLSTSAAALSTAIAGCSGGSDDDSTSETDEGTDSYGIHLRNDARDPHEVTVRATFTWEDVTPFEETVEVDPGESRTWNDVVTDEAEYTVEAEMTTRTNHTKSSHVFVTPGSEAAPPDDNVQVRVQKQEVERGTTASITVYFESRREDE